MHRTLQRAARLLLATGALGLAHPALADSSSITNATINRLRTGDGSRWVRPESPGRESSGSVHPSQAALEGMRVEMAWLADLSTFGHQLEVRVLPEALEIRGQVPDDTVRQHALRVARQNSFLPVIDAIRVSPTSSAPVSSPEDLYRTIVAHLTKEFGERAAGFEVRAQEDGQVVIRGSVASVEDKLAISRSLRKVPGCKAVHNDLSVATVVRSGVTITLISRDGSQAVRGPVPASSTETNTPGPVMKGEKPATQGTATTVPVSYSAGAEEEDLRLPRVSYQSATPIVLPPSPTFVLPSGLPPVRGPRAETGVPAAPSGPVNVIRPLHSTEPSETLPAELSGTTPILLTGGTEPSGNVYSGVPSTNSYPYTQGVSGNVAPTQRRTLWDRITSGRSAPSSQPSETVVTTTSDPLVPAVTPQAPKRTSYGTGDPGMVPGTLIPRQPAPATWPPAHSTQPAGPSPVVGGATPTQTQGVLKPTGNTQAAVPPAQALFRVSGKPENAKLAPVPVSGSGRTVPGATRVEIAPSKLTSLVQKAGGSMVQKVQVVREPDSTLRVVVEVKDSAAESKAIEKILQIPEMTMPGVRLEMNIGH